jgi:hypothetical protein
MKKFIFILLISTTIFSQSWIDEWQRSIVSIGVVDSLGLKIQNQIIYKKYFRVIGTGVLFYVKADTVPIPTLITAKHVFSDPEQNWFPDSVNIRFSSDDSKPINEYFGISIQLKYKNQNTWFVHPDSNVDVAGYVFLPNEINYNNIDVQVLPYSTIAAGEDLYQGAELFVFGYPSAVGVEFWTKPILRSGIIAWVPSDKNTGGKFLIDCDVFPGNSGGPVFKVPTGIGKDGKLQSGGKIQFVGIVSQRRFSPTQVMFGNKEIIDTLGNKLHSLESMGIGVIEPSIRVGELLEKINVYIDNQSKRIK